MKVNKNFIMDENSLLKKIAELEKEIARLKSLLDAAGVPDITFKRQLCGQLVLKDETKILREEITYNHARKFFSYFWGRMDVFVKRYQNKTTGKTGYFPQCENFWLKGICPKAVGNKVKCVDCANRNWTKLNAKHIQAHLRGDREDATDVVGVYPLFPDGTCRFIVFDFDSHIKDNDKQDFANADDKWKDEVFALRTICAQNKIPHLIERSRSGRGAHLWIFFQTPVNAALARRFGFALLNKGAETVDLKSFSFYDRMLPAQDMIGENELGNLIALPLQGRALMEGNSAFVDENWQAFPNQWKALLGTEKLSKSLIDQLVTDWNLPDFNDKEKTKNSFPNDDTKPWARHGKFQKNDVDGKLKVVISSQLYIEMANLKPRIRNQIRSLAAFSNPLFFKNNAIGLSNFANPRFIYLGFDDNGYICIPRGLFDTLKANCSESNIDIDIEEQRSNGKNISVEFCGTFREKQKRAMEELLKHDCGILSAATAFGKTVTCCGIIAKKKVGTLIILEASELIEQWEKALNTFLTIHEELPVYQTKTGINKRRKSIVGIIQGTKDTSTGIIDIAMVGSLYKKGTFHPRLKEYGLVLIDECHHCASDTFSAVIREITAKYIYGVTATPFRGDGLEKINYMLLGPVRFRYSAKEKAKEQGISHFVVPRFTRTVSPHCRDKMRISDAYKLICCSDSRNEQIVADIQKCISNGRTPVVLTRFTEHALTLYKSVRLYADKVFLLTGEKTKKERAIIRNEMEKTTYNESLILIATGQLVGEGFDFPRLDTLIMAAPVSGRGIVEQYAGRLNRDYEGKESVVIYDYIDSHIPVFDSMYTKRLKIYKNIGYHIYSDETPEKQKANAIYDSDSYLSIYEKDLLEAKSDIVIASPLIVRQKVYHTISLLKERQTAGVKITVVTLPPDAYKYGSEEYRIMLMEELKNEGFHIELTEENCQHYAVIDDEIVWYGSMNLFGKDDVDDNIMRIISKDIATELLELTFRKDCCLSEYALPK